jgi:hypothetical protein
VYVKAHGTDWSVSGDTFRIKDALKAQFKARWDKETSSWIIAGTNTKEGIEAFIKSCA